MKIENGPRQRAFIEDAGLGDLVSLSWITGRPFTVEGIVIGLVGGLFLGNFVGNELHEIGIDWDPIGGTEEPENNLMPRNATTTISTAVLLGIVGGRLGWKLDDKVAKKNIE